MLRCFTDRSDRLGVGGVDDKVWRAALRFSLDALPPGATVVTAELSLACDGRGFDPGGLRLERPRIPELAPS
jgi:hypothetical protein